ncbi:putative ribonuclease H-like domain-containing protein [Tanacetum coccineum]
MHRPVSTIRPVSTARPSVSTTRPVCTARPSVSTARISVSTARPNVSTARHVYATRPTYPRMDNGNLEILLQDHAVVDSGCSSHMTGNKAYISDYEDFNRGFMAFGSDPKGGKITGKDSDYGGASLDRKSTTGGCQFLGRRLISWQCKKQTIAANSTTEAEYVAAANCYG